jgi:hypothetical protein
LAFGPIGGLGRFGAIVERVSPALMLLACVPIGIDMPVPMSLPGRAPVAGLAPGGTPCGVTGTAVCASTGAPARLASTVNDSARERIGISPVQMWQLAIGYVRGVPQLWRGIASRDDKPVSVSASGGETTAIDRDAPAPSVRSQM